MSYVRDNIARMKGYMPGFQPKGSGYIKLNTNENPYPPSPRAVSAMQEVCSERIRKYPDPFAEDFRQKAAELFDIDPNGIICGFGSDDILTICIRTFCDPGDTIAFPYPSYSLYEMLAQIQDVRPMSVEFPEDYSIPEGLFNISASLTFLANPNSPSGTQVSTKAVEKLAHSVDGVLVVDEAYVDFAAEHCASLVNRCRNVIVTRTLSKSYSLAGLRFGYAMGDEALITEMMKVKDSYNVSAPGIAGATAAIEDQEWLQENVGKIVNTRQHLSDKLEQLGFRCWPSQANFVLAKVPEGYSAAQLHQDLFKNKILVRYFDLPRLDDCLRITIGTDAEIGRLLETLKELTG
jgi:histidinol-phosphate aminotransferase